MPFFEDVVLTDSIEIETTPEAIFTFITNIKDDESYRAWHQTDHVAFQWLKGAPWQEGSILYAEEYFHGKLHKFKFVITEVIPDKKIVYSPVSRILRLFFPKNEFRIKCDGPTCLFVASVNFKVGWIGKKIFKKSIDKGLASVRKHMKEEGENLKSLLEARNQT
ncbi:MAG: SRPBCC family protein [Desulfobulbaceae bacterium]|nr:MAG: SRPBCC family protein [Desulfobulbaceae bacterium]